jgi:hypothetical protein
MVQIPGYANRVITLKFEELSEPGDLVHIVMRNPKLLPVDELKPGQDIAIGADGQPLDTELAEEDTYRRLAKMIVGWHVYDATLTDEELEALGRGEEVDQRRLPLPATADSVRRLPNEIQRALIVEVEKVTNPS